MNITAGPAPDKHAGTKLTPPVTRREFLTLGAAVAAVPLINRNQYTLFALQQERYSKRAIDLVLSTTVIDMLGALNLSGSIYSRYMRKPADFTAADLQRFRDSGISVFHIGFGIGGVDAYGNVLRDLALRNGFLAHHHANLMRIDSPAALDGMKASGKIGVLLGIQNSQHFRTEDDVDFFMPSGSAYHSSPIIVAI